jgi:hypothetical protein
MELVGIRNAVNTQQNHKYTTATFICEHAVWWHEGGSSKRLDKCIAGWQFIRVFALLHMLNKNGNADIQIHMKK